MKRRKHNPGQVIRKPREAIEMFGSLFPLSQASPFIRSDNGPEFIARGSASGWPPPG